MFLVKPHLTGGPRQRQHRPSPISWSISGQSLAPLASRGVSHNPLSPWGTSRIPMSHRLNPISPLKGCGINPVTAHQGSPFRCQHPLALASSPLLGWAGAAPALAPCRDRAEPAPPAWHLLRQTQTLLLIFFHLLCKAFEETCPELGMLFAVSSRTG